MSKIVKKLAGNLGEAQRGSLDSPSKKRFINLDYYYSKMKTVMWKSPFNWLILGDLGRNVESVNYCSSWTVGNGEFCDKLQWF